MLFTRFFFLSIFLSAVFQPLVPAQPVEQLTQAGYVELFDTNHTTATFDSLYADFDELVEFFQRNPVWVQKLYIAKERFLRSKARNYYSTDIFGLYDETQREGRRQVSFYYSSHFHEFIYSHYPEFQQVPEIACFFEKCFQIEEPYPKLFKEVIAELNLEKIFSSNQEFPPTLIKVIKYLPSYNVTKPHYDGAILSLFLDSTDNESLMLSPYKASLTTDDFFSPQRESRLSGQRSILLVPGAFLVDFSIYPTPHIVLKSGKIRYATVAFAMRPNYSPQKIELTTLSRL